MSFDKIGDTVYYEISIKFEKLNDSLVIGKTNLESEKTQKVTELDQNHIFKNEQ